MAHSRAGVRNNQDEPQASSVPESKKVVKNNSKKQQKAVGF